MADIRATHTSNKQDWETPRWLFDVLNQEFYFQTDVCATEENRLCSRYFSPQIDGLTQRWTGSCYMNPPYSKIKAWMGKAFLEAQLGDATVVCLVPARTDTKWWWSYARWGEVRLLQGRLKFSEGKVGAPYPSAVIVFRNHFDLADARVIHWNPTKRSRQ